MRCRILCPQTPGSLWQVVQYPHIKPRQPLLPWVDIFQNYKPQSQIFPSNINPLVNSLEYSLTELNTRSLTVFIIPKKNWTPNAIFPGRTKLPYWLLKYSKTVLNNSINSRTNPHYWQSWTFPYWKSLLFPKRTELPYWQSGIFPGRNKPPYIDCHEYFKEVLNSHIYSLEYSQEEVNSLIDNLKLQERTYIN